MGACLTSEDEEKIREFIDNRVEQLTNSTSPEGISLVHNNIYNKFIHPDSNVRRSMIVSPIHLDDNEIYNILMEKVQQARADERYKDHSLRQIIPTAVQTAIYQYFGSLLTSNEGLQKNFKFYMDESGLDGPEFISIKDFKEEKMAVCAEKASVAQNLLRFSGLNSSIVFSSKCRIPAEAPEDAHAYNIIQSENGYFIYDPTNPNLVLNETKDTWSSYQPAFYKITEEQFDSILRKGKVEVNHVNKVLDEDGNALQDDVETRIYGG